MENCGVGLECHAIVTFILLNSVPCDRMVLQLEFGLAEDGGDLRLQHATLWTCLLVGTLLYTLNRRTYKDHAPVVLRS